jgi:hypothetical protein
LETEAIQLVEGALRDPDSLVRQTAAAELGQMKVREAIPSLKTAMDDAAGEVAFAAAKALWDMGDRSGRDLTSSGRDGFQRSIWRSAGASPRIAMQNPYACSNGPQPATRVGQ